MVIILPSDGVCASFRVSVLPSDDGSASFIWWLCYLSRVIVLLLMAWSHGQNEPTNMDKPLAEDIVHKVT